MSNIPLTMVCSADEHYSLPMAIMLYSAIRNYRGREFVQIYVLDAGVSLESKLKVQNILRPFPCVLHWIQPKLELLDGLPLKEHYPVSAWARLLMLDVLPPCLPKVIYMDCDVLVEANLENLWRTDTGDYCFLAVRDPTYRNLSESPLRDYFEGSPYATKPYFNSGVLLVDLERTRKNCLFERAKNFAVTYSHYIRFADQDALNAVSVNMWGDLDSRFNQFVRGDNPRCAYGTHEVLHFIGRKKPWLPRITLNWSNDYIGKAHGRYLSYLKSAGWFSGVGWHWHRIKCAYWRHLGNRLSYLWKWLLSRIRRFIYVLAN